MKTDLVVQWRLFDHPRRQEGQFYTFLFEGSLKHHIEWDGISITLLFLLSLNINFFIFAYLRKLRLKEYNVPVKFQFDLNCQKLISRTPTQCCPHQLIKGNFSLSVVHKALFVLNCVKIVQLVISYLLFRACIQCSINTPLLFQTNGTLFTTPLRCPHMRFTAGRYTVVLKQVSCLHVSAFYISS